MPDSNLPLEMPPEMIYISLDCVRKQRDARLSNRMNQNNSMANLVKLNENFPDKIDFYVGVKANLERNKDDYHKLVGRYMTMNLATASHNLALALLNEKISGFYLILKHDKDKEARLAAREQAREPPMKK